MATIVCQDCADMIKVTGVQLLDPLAMGKCKICDYRATEMKVVPGYLYKTAFELYKKPIIAFRKKRFHEHQEKKHA